MESFAQFSGNEGCGSVNAIVEVRDGRIPVMLVNFGENVLECEKGTILRKFSPVDDKGLVARACASCGGAKRAVIGSLPKLEQKVPGCSSCSRNR
uniref:Uncharacterized protein n=1 Tax=Romanomermis culicivorax TaxID=13658 RepID=A0A915IGD9_ROMCU